MIIHGARPRTEPEVILARLAELAEAFQKVTVVLHKFDGTQEDAQFGMEGFRVSREYLNSAWLWAKETLEQN
jgi:hypothetical protein